MNTPSRSPTNATTNSVSRTSSLRIRKTFSFAVKSPPPPILKLVKISYYRLPWASLDENFLKINYPTMTFKENMVISPQ
jgi:hypothetical protein